jgi:tetratricopeptide (TPR) repeat protein
MSDKNSTSKKSSSTVRTTLPESGGGSSTAQGNGTRGSEVPRVKNYVEGVEGRERTWTHPNWVLHTALAFAGNSRPLNASVDLVSIDFFHMRHIQRGIRFLQAYTHAKKSEKSLDECLLLVKNARFQLTKVSPENILRQLFLVETCLYLASDIMLTDLKTAEKLAGDASKSIEMLREAGFSPFDVDFKKIDIDFVTTSIDSIARAQNSIGAAWEKINRIDLALMHKIYSLNLFIHRHRHSKEPHVNVAALHANVGILFEMRGDLRTAINHKKKGLDMLLQITPGKDDERIATCLNNLGVSIQDSGDRIKGIRLQREALEMRYNLYGRNRDHEKIASSLNNLGAALEASSFRVEGIKLLRQGLAMNERLHPSGHKNLAMNLANLGAGLMHMGSLSFLTEARDLLERSVTMFIQLKTEHEADGEDIAIALNNLAGVKERLGDHDSSLHDNQRALIIRKQLYGERNVATLATSISCVGQSLIKRQNPEHIAQGKVMISEALTMFENCRCYSIDCILAVCAYLPNMMTRDDQKYLAVRMIPMMKQVLEFAPSHNKSYIALCFASVLDSCCPITSNLLRIQRDAADIQGTNERAAIRTFLQKDEEPVVEEPETIVEDRQLAETETLTPDAWRIVENQRISHFSAEHSLPRFVAPVFSKPETTNVNDDNDSLEAASTISPIEEKKDECSTNPASVDESSQSTSNASTVGPSRAAENIQTEPDNPTPKIANKDIGFRMAKNMVDDAINELRKRANGLPVQRAYDPGVTLARIRGALDGKTIASINITLVSTELVRHHK